MLIKLLRKFLGAVIFTCLFFSASTYVNAQDNHTYRGEIITPFENILHGGRGTTITGSILFSNDQVTGDILTYINIHDFKPDSNGNGIDENVSYDYNSSLSSWTSLSDTKISVKKGESAKINYTIKVPATAVYGSKYATISFDRILPTDNLSNINLKTRIHHLIFFNVDGDLIENLSINKFTSDKNIYFDTNPTITFKSEILNTGNIHLIPKGYIEINGLFNNTQVQFNPSSDQKEGYILPDPNIVREYVSSWSGNNLKFGLYNATLHLKYGQDSNEKVISVSFYIFPWTTLVSGGITIIILSYLVYYNIKRIGKRKIKIKKGRPY